MRSSAGFTSAPRTSQRHNRGVRASGKSLVAAVLVVAALAAAGIAALYLRPSLPAPGSEPYEQISRAFYHGLAALEVGLLDDARQQFTQATVLVPEEPAAWANLGLTQLRLGELEAAVQPVERALALAPLWPC